MSGIRRLLDTNIVIGLLKGDPDQRGLGETGGTATGAVCR